MFSLPLKLISILACLALSGVGQAALAATSQTAEQSELKSLQAMILQLIAEQRYDEAQAAAEAFQPDHPNHTSRVAFVDGMIAKAQGKNRDAAKAFRQVLVDQPELVPARQYLAQALFLDGDYEAAQHQFGVLESVTTDPRLRQLYSSYSAKMSEQQPWSISGYVNLAPSTNINRGTSKKTADIFGLPFKIDKAAQKSSGVGLAAGTYGSYAMRLDQGFSIIANAGVDGRFYLDSQSDILKLSGSIKPTFTSQDHTLRIGVGPYVETVFESYEQSVVRYGGVADFSFKFGDGYFFSASSAFLFQEYEKNPTRDGTKVDLDARLLKTIDPTLSVGLIGGALQENTDRDDYNHIDYSAGFSISKEWQGGWMTSLEPSVSWHDYDGLIPGKNESREDFTYGASVRISNRELSAYGFMPVLNYSYTKQNSNDEFSDYDSHDISLSLSKAF